MKKIVIVLISLCFISSCKKKKLLPPCETVINKIYTNDTIFPSEYLMAYPGSWWKYETNNPAYIPYLNYSCDSWVEVSVPNKSYKGTCLTITQSISIMPKCNFGIIDFDNIVKINPNYAPPQSSPFIRLNPGVFYEEKVKDGDEVKEKEYTSYGIIDTMTVGSTLYHDVLYIRYAKSTSYESAPGYGNHYHEYAYYAKGVGKIYFNIVSSGYALPYTSAKLIDYYIAPH